MMNCMTNVKDEFHIPVDLEGDVKDVKEAVQNIIRNGWELIPLEDNSKAIRLGGWQSGSYSIKKFKELASQPGHGKCLGIRTGRVVAVDDDTLDRKLQETVALNIRDTLGESKIHKIGNPNKGGQRYFLVDGDELPGKIVVSGEDPNGVHHQVEILGRNRQAAILGHVTQKVPKPYTIAYASGDTPINTKLDALTKVTVTNLHELAEKLRTAFIASGLSKVTVTHQNGLKTIVDGKEIALGESAMPDKIDDPVLIQEARSVLMNRKPAVEDAGGDEQTLVAVYRCRDLNLTPETIFELMTEDGGYNDRCTPPWGYDELKVKIDNAFRYPKKQWGCNAKQAFDSKELWDSVLGDNDNTPAKPGSQSTEVENPDETHRSRIESIRVNLKRVDDFIEDTPPADWMIENWIPWSNVSIFNGRRGCGKTSLLVYLTCCVTHGIQIGPDMDDDVTVIFIPLENPSGVAGQFDVFFAEHPEVKRNDRRLRVFTEAVNLFRDDWEGFCGDLVKVIIETMDHKKVLFIWDTWQRLSALATNGQNDDKAMSEGIRRLEYLSRKMIEAQNDRDRRSGNVICCHPPKSNLNTVSGSQQLENLSQHIVQVTGQKAETRTAEVERSKGGPEGIKLEFELESAKRPNLRNPRGKPYYAAIIRLGSFSEAVKPNMLCPGDAKARWLANDVADCMDAAGETRLPLTKLAKLVANANGQTDHGIPCPNAQPRKMGWKAIWEFLEGGPFRDGPLPLKDGTRGLLVVEGNQKGLDVMIVPLAAPATSPAVLKAPAASGKSPSFIDREGAEDIHFDEDFG